MKSFIWMFIISLSLLACDTDKSPVSPETGLGTDYTIYRLALDAYFNENIPAIILGDSTRSELFLDEQYWKRLVEEGVDLEEETWHSYIENNTVNVALEPLDGIDITFRSQIADSAIYSKPQVSLSRVGYDDARSQAIVTVGVVFAPLAGSGMLYYLEYVKGEWVIIAERMTWIS